MQYRNSSYSNETFNTYWFEKNLQGDIVAVYNENGTKLVSYTYDAWGKVTTTYHNSGAYTAAQYNSFRYRGYYYDTELGFYYLNSRYYDPETSRVISADTYLGANADINSYNQFAYCSNNPIRYIDPSGEFILSLVIACAIVGVAAGFGITAYTDYVDDGEVFNGSVGVEDYVANTIVGGLAGAAAGYVAPSIWTFLSSSFTMTTTAFVGEAATAVTVTGAQIVGAGLALGSIVFFANRSGKEMSSGKPSWVNKNMVDFGKSAQQNAKDILNNKYGPGNWKEGPGTEYNKIVKWIVRKIFYRK